MKKPIVGIASGYIYFVALLVLAFFMHERQFSPEFATTGIITVAGVVVGWMTGLLASPYDNTESQRFAKYAAVVSTFLSGYVLGKVDPLITSALSPEQFNAPSDGGALLMIRIFLFIASAIIGAVTMYTYRLYLGRTGSTSLPQPPNSPPQADEERQHSDSAGASASQESPPTTPPPALRD